MNTSPFSTIDQLLSTKGIDNLYNKCNTYTDDQMEWFESDDGQATYGFYPTLSEQDKTKLTPLVQSALVQQLEELISKATEEIDNKLFTHSSERERRDFCIFLRSRVAETLETWNSLSHSKEFPDVTEFLNRFKDGIQRKLDYYSKAEQAHPIQEEVDEPTIELPEKLYAKINTKEALELDIRQTALLFHYLKENRAILKHYNTDLALLVHILTGYSESRLKKGEGFGAIWSIIKDEVKDENYHDVPNYNLNAVKRLLLKIVSQIDASIEKNDKPRK